MGAPLKARLDGLLNDYDPDLQSRGSALGKTQPLAERLQVDERKSLEPQAPAGITVYTNKANRWMRNRERWVPSKFVYRNGRLRSSTIRANVGSGSRLMVDLIARCYDDHLREHARGRLVDLGCGKVPLLHVYESFVAEVTCADWQHTIHRNDYLDTECDLTAELPFADGEFDTAVLSDVLEHIPEPQHLIAEIARILAPSGRLVMNVPFYYWLHETPYDYYRYTEYALRRLMESAGLKILLLEPIGGAPEILADIIAKNLLFIPRVGAQLAILLQKVTFAFVQTRLGRRISVRTAENFPFGYFLVAEKSGEAFT